MMTQVQLDTLMQAIKSAIEQLDFIDESTIDMLGDSIDFDLTDGSSHWVEVY